MKSRECLTVLWFFRFFLTILILFCLSCVDSTEPARSNIFDKKNKEDVLNFKLEVKDGMVLLTWNRLTHEKIKAINVYQTPYNDKNRVKLITSITDISESSYLDPTGAKDYYFYKIAVIVDNNGKEEIFLQSELLPNFEVVEKEEELTPDSPYYCTEKYKIADVLEGVYFDFNEKSNLLVYFKTLKKNYKFSIKLSNDSKFKVVYQEIKDIAKENYASDKTYDFFKTFFYTLTVKNGCDVSAEDAITSSFKLKYKFQDNFQTECFNDTERINCPVKGEPYFGQDGNYNFDTIKFDELPNDYYDPINNIYYNKNRPKDFLMYTEGEAFCSSLQEGISGKYRIPEIWELWAFEYYGVEDAIWTATKHNIESTFYLDMKEKTSGYLNYIVGNSKKVICVSGPKTTIYKMVDKKDVIEDRATDLVWQKKSSDLTFNFKEALNYCENLTLAGYENWRLPSLFEVYTIIRFNEETWPAFLVLNNKGSYATSTTFNGRPKQIYIFEGSLTKIGNGEKNGSYNVICVHSKK